MSKKTLVCSLRCAAVGAAALVGVALGAGSAGGEIYDTIVPTYTYAPLGGCREGSVNGGSGCQTDNSYLSYYMDSVGEYELEAEDRTRVRTVLEDQFEPSVLDINYDSDPTFSGSAETDII